MSNKVPSQLLFTGAQFQVLLSPSPLPFLVTHYSTKFPVSVIHTQLPNKKRNSPAFVTADLRTGANSFPTEL